MIIHTNKHKIAFQIDESDWEAISYLVWHVDSGGYVRGRYGRLHQFLLGKAPVGLEWDHKNRDKMDNRRDNLRLVTQLVNRRNQGIRSTNTSGVTGVKRYKNGWRVQIGDGLGKQIFLGWYADFEEAVKVRTEFQAVFWNENAPI